MNSLLRTARAAGIGLLAVLSNTSCQGDLEPLDWPVLAALPDAGRSDAGPLDATATAATVSELDEPEAARRRQDAGPPLAAAMKGYELYAWSEDGHLHFTLIVGTNRQKTVEEIVGRGGGTLASEASPIHGIGSAELSRILMRVPQGTAVIFTGLPGLPPLGAEERATVERLVARGGVL